jgi:lipoprotein-anchoring transpeptidase ErfK/SrfK
MADGTRVRTRAIARLFQGLAVAFVLLITPPVNGTESVASQGTTSSGAWRVPGPSPGTGTWTARALSYTAVVRRPGARRAVWVAGGDARWSRTAQRLMVLRAARAQGRTWLKVRLPGRPNGSSGWIPRDRVRLARSPHYLIVDISRRRLIVYRNGRRVAMPRVVVGAPATPTPLGLFAIYDRVAQRDPGGFTGPWVLPLTAHSEKLRRFDGGPGLVAIHGRAGASLRDPLGTARSRGCIRMANGWIRNLARVIMKGTAVRIRR